MKILIIFFFFLISISIIAAEDSIFHECEGNNYTSKSDFKTNLYEVLSTLASSNSSFGTNVTGSSPSTAYGLFLCRGDVDPTTCKSCVQSASVNITLLCPNSKQAIVWYDLCQLRYSDAKFFGSADGKNEIQSNPANGTNPDQFTAMVKELMQNVADYAAYKSPSLFATGMMTYQMDLPPIYGFAECTRDLSPNVCRQCLQQSLVFYWTSANGYNAPKQGGKIYAYSCNFRYEIYPFLMGNPTVSLNLTASPPSPSPPPGEDNQGGKGKKKNIGKVLAIAISLALGSTFLVALCIFLWRKRSSKYIPASGIANIDEITNTDSLLYDLSVVKAATNNFSEANKLGEGGFGAVYKGILPGGDEIAVKRLSASSKQGIGELKNELLLVAKLQHKNLVRLRGVCLEEHEKLLIYQYVPNRSLDTFLFDKVKCTQLYWERRFNIIGGIARGLRYLHEESHSIVIHRDLKASNVLLDANMNPKIADFGLARLFSVDETQCRTNRVVGTYGYMAPEYAMLGRFSVKLDVFSFGVLVLEIVTGRRNNSCCEEENYQALINYTWEHWSDGTPLVIVDPSLGVEFSRDEALRCIQIGLLCVQDVPANRPLMSTVVLMLSSPSVTIPAPLQPVLGSAVGTDDSSTSTKRSNLDSGNMSQ